MWASTGRGSRYTPDPTKIRSRAFWPDHMTRHVSHHVNRMHRPCMVHKNSLRESKKVAEDLPKRSQAGMMRSCLAEKETAPVCTGCRLSKSPAEPDVVFTKEATVLDHALVPSVNNLVKTRGAKDERKKYIPRSWGRAEVSTRQGQTSIGPADQCVVRISSVPGFRKNWSAY